MRIDLANPVSNHPLNAGLVGWWLPLRNNSGGRTLYDIAGRYPGALVNGPTWGVGPNSAFGSVVFDGANDYGQVTHAAPLSVARPFSVAAWVKYTTTSNTVIFEKNGNSGFSVQVDNTTSGKLTCWVGGVNNGVSTTSAWNDGKWHFVVFAMGAAADAVYVDGRADTTTAGSVLSPSYGASTPVYFGSRAGVAPWAGSLGGVRLATGAVTDSDAACLYDQARRDYPDLLRRLPTGRSFVGVAGGGGGFQAAWARGSNVLIGAGAA